MLRNALIIQALRVHVPNVRLAPRYLTKCTSEISNNWQTDIIKVCYKITVYDIEEGRRAFKILTDLKRPLGRPRCRWEGNIRKDLEEIGINAENWVDSACECGIEPPGSISHGVSI